MKNEQTFPCDKLACVDNKWKGVNKLIFFLRLLVGRVGLRKITGKTKSMTQIESRGLKTGISYRR